MMTISSAETYFSNPMQKTADGGAEPASLFSPFWDARLRQPSKIAYLIATGDIDFRELFEGLGSTALGMIDWLLRAIGEKLVQSGIDYLLEQIGPPWDSFVEDPIRDAGSQVVDFTVDAVIGELEEFLP